MPDNHKFIHLRAHSAYSLSQGAITVSSLVDLTAQHKMPAIALTDSGNLFGSLEFSQSCIKQNIQPIIGVEINLLSANSDTHSGKFILIAKDKQGYDNLLKLVSDAYLDGDDCHNPLISQQNLAQYNAGIIALTGGADSLLNQYIIDGNKADAQILLQFLQHNFGDRLYIELMRHDLADEQKAENELIELAFKHEIPLVATNDVMFSRADMFEAQDALMCIAAGRYIAETDRLRYTQEHYFKSQDEMCKLFADIPEAIENTVNIARRCSVISEARDPMLPSMGAGGASEDDELRRIAYEGLEQRLEKYVYPYRRSESGYQRVENLSSSPTSSAGISPSSPPSLAISTESPPPPAGGVGGGVNSTRNPIPLKFAKTLRKNLSKAEAALWNILKNSQIEDHKFRKQQAIGNYIVDFICNKKGLIIELDGGQHAQQKDYDQNRTEFLENHGYKVIRFWNNDVLENIEGVYDIILKELNKLNEFHRESCDVLVPTNVLTPPPTPPAGGGGEKVEGASVGEHSVEGASGEGGNQKESCQPSTANGQLAYKEKIAAPYRQRLDFELDVICKMGFAGYFLIVSDFIRWSKEQDIPVGPGRGSGAGSVVAWVMLITDLDPLRYGLLFERFLNPERVSMPDFDIDFCQDRREEVIQYVQDKYGKERVAQIITFGKLQAKAVLRDVGRVMQMPYGQIDRMCKLIPFNPAKPPTLTEAINLVPEMRKEAKADENVEKLLDISLKLEGMYRHASTHAAGVVIGAQPLVELVPLYTDHKSPIPTTQYSMKYAEMAGLVKFDFLGLKTLTTIANACKLVREQGHGIDIDHIPIDDKKTFAMLSKGDSTGVFQMESAGMRDAMRKMRPDTIEDIIALISLYRPGPMENIPTYIARKHGREAPDYMHPSLEPCLKETFGVIIYQEQVMEIAKVLAGYSLGGADLLRRAMGKKIKSEMDAQRVMFMEGAEKNNVDPKKAGDIFDLVAKFAGYGFNKSHAAAYALIGYQTAYLKAHYPVEFLTASMNIDINDTDKLSMFYNEARMQGIIMLPPDVNRSDSFFSVESLVAAASPTPPASGVGEEGLLTYSPLVVADSVCAPPSPAPSTSSPPPPAGGVGGGALQRSELGEQRAEGKKESCQPSTANGQLDHKTSQPKFNIAIRYALGALKGVGVEAMELLVEERKATVFKNIFDFARRLDSQVINKRQIEGLAKSGSFDSFNLNRQQIVEGASVLGRYSQSVAEEKASNQVSLFGDVQEDDSPAGIIPDMPEWNDDDKYAHEYQAVGFYLTGHPLDKYYQDLKESNIIFADMQDKRIADTGGKYKMCGIITGITYRSSKRGRFAYLYLCDATGNLEMSIFNEKMLENQSDILKVGTQVVVKVDARRDEGGIRLQVDEIELLADYLSAKKCKFTLHLDYDKLKNTYGKNPLQELKNHLIIDDNGRALICAKINTPHNTNVTINFKQNYHLTNDFIENIEKLDIVKKIYQG